MNSKYEFEEGDLSREFVNEMMVIIRKHKLHSRVAVGLVLELLKSVCEANGTIISVDIQEKATVAPTIQ